MRFMKKDVSKFIERMEDETLKRLVSEIVMESGQEELSEAALHDYINTIKAESSAKNTLKSLKRQLRMYEKQNDPIAAAKIADEILQIQKKLKQ